MYKYASHSNDFNVIKTIPHSIVEQRQDAPRSFFSFDFEEESYAESSRVQLNERSESTRVSEYRILNRPRYGIKEKHKEYRLYPSLDSAQ